MCHEITEQMRQNDRVIKKTQREMDRERADLERQEKKLVSINRPMSFTLGMLNKVRIFEL